MKKFYENPMVEITVFDVEDVITTSVAVTTVDTLNMSEEDLTELQTAVAGTADSVVDYNSYKW